jgi:hypothetical protein
MALSRYDRNCPSCGKMMSPMQIPIWQSGGFPCPGCGRLLRSSVPSLKLAWLITLFITIGICFFFRLSSPTAIAILLITSVALSFIVNAVMGLVSMVPLELVPRKLVPSKNRLQRHLARFDRICPSCGEVVLQSQIPIWESGGFPCRACGGILKSSVPTIKLTLPVTLTVSLSLCFYFGLRGLRVILVTLIASVPLYFIVSAIISLIFPPGLELVSRRIDRLDR